MEVGKKYKNSGTGEIVNCLMVTPNGYAVVVYDKYNVEAFILKGDFHPWKEVKDKQKVYVFLVEVNGVNTPYSYNRKIDAESCVKLFQNTSYKVVSEITEVEIEEK